MPSCDLCDCWTTEASTVDGLEQCAVCMDVTLDGRSRWALRAGDGEAVLCAECRRPIALHAGDVRPDGAPTHVGCGPNAGEVAGIAPGERAVQAGHEPPLGSDAIAEALGVRPKG